MFAPSILSLFALVSSVITLTSAGPIQNRQSVGCSPYPSFDVNIVWAGNTSLQLGTSDCEACIYLGLYTGGIDYFSFQATGNGNLQRILSPDYSGQVLTVDLNSTVSPISRAPQSAAEDAFQSYFNFVCNTCTTEQVGYLCEFQFVQDTETLCVTTDGELNVGGLSLQSCNGTVGQIFNIVPAVETGL